MHQLPEHAAEDATVLMAVLLAIHFAMAFWLHSLQERISHDKWHKTVTGQIPLLLCNQRYQRLIKTHSSDSTIKNYPLDSSFLPFSTVRLLRKGIKMNCVKMTTE